MSQKLINKLYEARKEGKVNKEIEIAEKLNYFFSWDNRKRKWFI